MSMNKRADQQARPIPSSSLTPAAPQHPGGRWRRARERRLGRPTPGLGEGHLAIRFVGLFNHHPFASRSRHVEESMIMSTTSHLYTFPSILRAHPAAGIRAKRDCAFCPIALSGSGNPKPGAAARRIRLPFVRTLFLGTHLAKQVWRISYSPAASMAALPQSEGVQL